MNDYRYAVRQVLGKGRGFTVIVVLTLSIGVSMVATQYSLADGLFFNPLPFADADRLYHVAQRKPQGDRPWAFPTRAVFAAQSEAQTSFEHFAAYSAGRYSVAAEGLYPIAVEGVEVSEQFFDVLGVPPLLGRHLQRQDFGIDAPRRVVLTHRMWRENFSTDPTLIGRQIQLSGKSATVVGVMPAGIQFPGRERFWLNMPALELDAPAGQVSVESFGIVKPGVDPVSAEAELSLIANKQLSAQFAESDDPYRAIVQRVQMAYNDGGGIALLAVLQTMTLLVLLVACINVANLMYVRGSQRVPELAVRSALGAGRYRVVRQLLLESVLLGILGAIASVILSALGVGLLQSQLSANVELPEWIVFGMNHRVLAVATGSAVLAAVFAGVWPAFRVASLNPSAVLKQGSDASLGFSRSRVLRVLVVGQLAFASVALVIGGLLALNVVRAGATNSAIAPQSTMSGRIEPRGERYEDGEQRQRYFANVLRAVEGVPSVELAALSSRDLVRSATPSRVEVEGRSYVDEDDYQSALLEVVSHRYFDLVNVRVTQGRLFGGTDRVDALPVAVVNQSFAARHWPGESPIGKRLRHHRADQPTEWLTVVGVVPDLNMQGLGRGGDSAGWYVAQAQSSERSLFLLARSSAPPDSLSLSLREAVASVDAQQTFDQVGTLATHSRKNLAGLRVIGGMANVFAIAALILAGVGVYGVIAQNARSRTREFGLRVALGAGPAHLLRLIFRQTLLGTCLGIAAGLLLARLLAGLIGPTTLGTVSPSQTEVYVVVALMLVGTAAAACWLPAYRAVRADPMRALRAE